jgi:large subunit ribosomal protein L28
MSRICEITGKKMITGNKVSHSNKKTKRRFYPNLQTKRFYLPEEDRWITIKLSTDAMRLIDKKGITAVVKEAREKGYLQK